MTLALRLDGGLAIASPVDRGFSDDARTVKELAISSPFTPSIARAERKFAAIQALKSALLEAQTDGREAHGWKPVDAGAFTYAVRLLGYLPDPTPLPEIAVDSDGDVALEWDEGPRRVFSVRVTRDGTLYYAGLDGQSVFHGSEPLREGVPSTVSAGINRIVSEPQFQPRRR